MISHVDAARCDLKAARPALERSHEDVLTTGALQVVGILEVEVTVRHEALTLHLDRWLVASLRVRVVDTVVVVVVCG